MRWRCCTEGTEDEEGRKEGSEASKFSPVASRNELKVAELEIDSL